MHPRPPPRLVRGSQVPFENLDRVNKYPVKGFVGTVDNPDTVPLDWQLVGNVNLSNSAEHVGDRWK